MNELITHKGDYRTAPVTLGLLISFLAVSFKVDVTNITLL